VLPARILDNFAGTTFAGIVFPSESTVSGLTVGSGKPTKYIELGLLITSLSGTTICTFFPIAATIIVYREYIAADLASTAKLG
jgi:hypothetical protein